MINVMSLLLRVLIQFFFSSTKPKKYGNTSFIAIRIHKYTTFNFQLVGLALQNTLRHFWRCRFFRRLLREKKLNRFQSINNQILLNSFCTQTQPFRLYYCLTHTCTHARVNDAWLMRTHIHSICYSLPYFLSVSPVQCMDVLMEPGFSITSFAKHSQSIIST